MAGGVLVGERRRPYRGWPGPGNRRGNEDAERAQGREEGRGVCCALQAGRHTASRRGHNGVRLRPTRLNRPVVLFRYFFYFYFDELAMLCVFVFCRLYFEIPIFFNLNGCY